VGHKPHISYRSDIDGLRAIAVAIVVINHGWTDQLTGGFVGVDIFFVISGFLISGIIIKQTTAGKFTYTDFYSRRIRRIYPALILMLTFVLFVGCWKLMNRVLELTTKTMAASTIFGANIQLLMYKKDYFDPDTRMNFLLHLWSLGVEEQFYIIWPLFIAIVIKFFKDKGIYLLTAFTVLSFALNVCYVSSQPKMSFYFPFCRFWQMSIGGILAYLSVKIQNKYVTNAISFVSISAIFIIIFVLDETSLFPGWWALVPTLSAAGIILAG
jgi:peptidoglycan/LPS O-acetylase OafA/YrhL